MTKSRFDYSFIYVKQAESEGEATAWNRIIDIIRGVPLKSKDGPHNP